MPETCDLLPGEDPRSELADDARHWIEVYRELGRELERMVGGIDEGASLLDRQRLVAQDRHVGARLRYWQRRLHELDGFGLS